MSQQGAHQRIAITPLTAALEVEISIYNAESSGQNAVSLAGTGLVMVDMTIRPQDARLKDSPSEHLLAS